MLTLRAGAVGLNLAHANHVVFGSPCLDTSLRKQAIGCALVTCVTYPSLRPCPRYVRYIPTVHTWHTLHRDTRGHDKQAIGRCHRMGQSRPVRVTTLALARTVEEVALGLLQRDLPPRSINGNEVTDQQELRLIALCEAALA